MPTTTRSSERRLPRAAARPLGLLGLLGLGACATGGSVADAFRLTPEAGATKAAQTRRFETRDATGLLSASAAVLQDLGFHVEESVRELGLLHAVKERSALESRQEIERVALYLLSFGSVLMPIDLQQQIAATLVARPVGADAARQEVRVTFYRVVWQGDGVAGRDYVPPGRQSIEMIRDPAIYRQFFAKLSQAVFLEAYTL